MSMNESATRSGGKDRFGLNTYPNPFFDPANWYIPPTIKELYRWCSYLFLTNSIVGPIVRKKASYVVTDLIYETENAQTERIYKDLFERILRIKEFETQMLMDFEVFGNAFASIVYPFDRYLVCPTCGFENLLKNISWVYEGFHFRGKCGRCRAHTTMEVMDKPVRNRARGRLMRWFPQYIDVRFNVFTGSSEYILRVPKWMKTRLGNPKINKVYVADTPKEFLEALRDDKVIELNKDNIFHMKHESISMEDSSLGVPPILNVFKDVWLWQTYKRGQEAVALEHTLPLTLLSPAPASGAPAPHFNTDLMAWQGKMSSIIEKWRRDQNAIFTMPFPVQVSQVRGDAQALSLHNDTEQVRQQIAGGCDVPAGFLFGDMVWSSANVSMRVLENLLINRLSRVEAMLQNWLAPSLRMFFRLPRCTIRHQDFKMADDVSQKQIAMNLRATNTVSDQTVLEELDFDYAKEEERKRGEFDRRLKEMERNQVAQAEISAKVAVINARAQAEVMRIQTEAQTALQQPQANVEPQPTPRVLPEPESPVTLSSRGAISPTTVDFYANHFIKTTPPDEVDNQLMFLKDTEPVLARAIERRLDMVRNGAKALNPLPEQRPPRRGPETALV